MRRRRKLPTEKPCVRCAFPTRERQKYPKRSRSWVIVPMHATCADEANRVRLDAGMESYYQGVTDDDLERYDW